MATINLAKFFYTIPVGSNRYITQKNYFYIYFDFFRHTLCLSFINM